jgi:hypothetical protein
VEGVKWYFYFWPPYTVKEGAVYCTVPVHIHTLLITGLKPICSSQNFTIIGVRERFCGNKCGQKAEENEIRKWEFGKEGLELKINKKSM